MEAISPRAPTVAALVIACAVLVGLAGAIQPVATPLVETPATILTAATPVSTPTAPVEASMPISTPSLASPAAPGGAGTPLTIVLDLRQNPAVWGDTVHISGTGAGGETVLVLVDGIVVGTADPDAAGAYRLDYLVDRIRAGTHVVSAEAGPGLSADASLEVAAVDPVVLLSVAPTTWKDEPALLCTGNVTANGRGVPDAPVHLVFNNYGTAECTTGPEGQFEVTAGVEGGSHRVVANVSFADRPLNPAVSAAVQAELPGGFPVLQALGAVAVLLAGGWGFYFWRRRRPADDVPKAAVPPSSTPVAPATPLAAEAAPAPRPAEDLRTTALRLAGDGGRDGVEAVYRDLVSRLAEREPGARIESMTPRELAAHFARTTSGVAVARVAACYEAVAYTGRPPTPVDVETMVEGYVAALSESARAGG